MGLELTQEEIDRLAKIEYGLVGVSPGPWEEATNRLNDRMSTMGKVRRRARPGWRLRDLWIWCIKRRYFDSETGLPRKGYDDDNFTGVIAGLRWSTIKGTHYVGGPAPRDLDFMAAARQDVPWLIDLVRKLAKGGE